MEVRGRLAFCEYMRRVRNAFPDFNNKIEQLVAEGDRVVARLQYTGTHRGEIFGVRPSGKAISYAGAAFSELPGTVSRRDGSSEISSASLSSSQRKHCHES